MAVILPLLCFGFFFLALKDGFPHADLRAIFLGASLAWGIFLTLVTEILSAFNLISFEPFLLAWMMGVALAAGAWVWTRSRNGARRITLEWPFDRPDSFLIACTVSVLVVIGIIAVQAPPNTVDSLTYHMSRVMHWIQDRNLGYYPTHVLRQLHQNPWSEFAILHGVLLNGGDDRLANLVQWYSMVGSIVGVSLIAKELGAGTRGQVIAGVVCVTIPMGILQGSSTQNDYTVSFWITCFAYFALRLQRQATWPAALAAGASLGLAVLTKATAYPYLAPFLLWIALALFIRQPKRATGLLAVVALVALALNLGYFERNYAFYGSPLGPGQEGADNSFKYINDSFDLSSLSSNLVRNLSVHIGVPLRRVNVFLTDQIYALHVVLGISPNDPRTTWTGTRFVVPNPSLNEDWAGNLLHLVLIGICASLVVVGKGLGVTKGAPILYLLAVAASFVLFCFLLKWQPWNSRLHLPLFVLLSAFVALVLSKLDFRFTFPVLVVLLVAALPWLFLNSTRPLLGSKSIFLTGRLEQYFANYPSLVLPYQNAVQAVPAQCRDIGLNPGAGNIEYLYWVLLRESRTAPFTITNTNVDNISRRQAGSEPLDGIAPCAIIEAGASPFPDLVQYRDKVYSRTFSSKAVSVYEPE